MGGRGAALLRQLLPLLHMVDEHVAGGLCGDKQFEDGQMHDLMMKVTLDSQAERQRVLQDLELLQTTREHLRRALSSWQEKHDALEAHQAEALAATRSSAERVVAMREERPQWSQAIDSLRRENEELNKEHLTLRRRYQSEVLEQC